MAQLVVRNLDEEVKAKLRRRAAAHGRSMEEEVRAILARRCEGRGASEGWAWNSHRGPVCRDRFARG